MSRIHGVAQLIRGAKHRLVPILNLDRLVGLWIAPGSGRSVLNLKHPKLAELDAPALLHRPAHRRHEALYDRPRLDFREAGPLSNLIDEVCFGHGHEKPGNGSVEVKCVGIPNAAAEFVIRKAPRIFALFVLSSRNIQGAGANDSADAEA